MDKHILLMSYLAWKTGTFCFFDPAFPKPVGRLKVATGGSPWFGPHNRWEPRRGD